MAKTWYGHHIETIKGEDYVLHKDYTELQNELDKYKNIVEELEKWLKEKYEITENSYFYAIADTIDEFQELKGGSDEI